MLVTYPNAILEEKSKKITNPQAPEIKKLIREMSEILEKQQGVGLAAPQVGKSLRLCLVNVEGKKYILINPEIKSKSLRKVVLEEGCLSFPGIFVKVKRHKKVKLKALDEKGNKITIKAAGILSQVFQHEVDHLEGVTIEDRKIKNEK